MSESTQPGEYPNQALGIDFETDSRQGAINSLSEPLKIGTVIFWSGAGVPTIGGNVGDFYIRSDPAGDSTYFYRCTVAGAAGAATWAAITGA